MKKVLQLGNIASVIFAIAANAATATSSVLPSIRTASQQTETLLNPATYAFSIWSLIYAGIAALALYQARDLFAQTQENSLPQKLSGWFILANLMNGIWTYVFVSGYIGLSVLVILTLLFSLLMLIKRLDIALFDASLSTIAFVWWPILVYTGWVLDAAVVNAATYAKALGIIITPKAAMLVLITLAVVLTTLLWKRNVRSLVLASTWGIAAIGVAQHGQTPLVWNTAAAVSTILILFVTIHAYQNRATNPLKELFEK